MNVNTLLSIPDLKPIYVADEEREITSCYIGDLLSWVMGRAKDGDAWVTIMTNINVLAVASLADVACVVLAENVPVETAIVDAAAAKGITLLRSPEPTFLLCARIHAAVNGDGV